MDACPHHIHVFDPEEPQNLHALDQDCICSPELEVVELEDGTMIFYYYHKELTQHG